MFPRSHVHGRPRRGARIDAFKAVEVVPLDGIFFVARGARNVFLNVFLPSAQTAARGAGPAASCELCER